MFLDKQILYNEYVVSMEIYRNSFFLSDSFGIKFDLYESEIL